MGLLSWLKKKPAAEAEPGPVEEAPAETTA